MTDVPSSEDDVRPITEESSDANEKVVLFLKRKYDRLAGRTNRMEWWAAGVVLVCFLAFVGFIVDAYRFHASTLADFRETLTSMEASREREIQASVKSHRARIEDLEHEVFNLTSKLDSLR